MIFSLFFIMFLLVTMLISLGLTALRFVALWKIFKKAGRPGWYAIIPFYNLFVLADIGDTNIIWPIVSIASPILTFIVSFVISFSMDFVEMEAGSGILDPISSLITLFFSALIYVATFVIMINLAKKFDKDTVYGIGMALIPVVFLTMLAFDKSKYNSTNSGKKVEENKKVLCTNCGELNEKGTNYCTNCGEEL